MLQQKANVQQGLCPDRWGSSGLSLEELQTPVGAGRAGVCQPCWVTPRWRLLWTPVSLVLAAGCGLEVAIRVQEPVLYFQAKEAHSKQKEFEETAKEARCAIEQLAAAE